MTTAIRHDSQIISLHQCTLTLARRGAERRASGAVRRGRAQAIAERQTRFELIAYSGAALVLIVLILLVSLHWRASGWLVMVNLPFSLLGGVFAIAITGIGLSLGSLAGLVRVFGVSARNAILQLAHYEHVVEVQGMEWNFATVLRGANERLIPILMTAAVTALGLAPLAVGLHSPGQEIEAPMAITVRGGLRSSTFLTLVVLPILVHRYGGPGGPRKAGIERPKDPDAGDQAGLLPT